MEAAHDGSNWDVLQLGDLLITQFGFREENEGGSDGGIESLKCLVEQSPEVFALQATRGIGFQSQLEPFTTIQGIEVLSGVALALPPRVECRVGHDPHQPSPKLTSTVKLIKVDDGLEKRVLNHIKGVLFPSKQPDGYSLRHDEVPAEQLFAGRPVTLSRSLQE